MSKRSQSPPEDGDSTMHDNSPSPFSDNEDLAPTAQQLGQNTPLTPTHPLREPPPHSELSPTDSQSLLRHRDVATVAAFGSTSTSSPSKAAGQEVLNSNGKREHASKASTGYTWEKEEDAPGYSWMNKKAQDDMARAMGQIVDFDQQIKMRYGDVLDNLTESRGR